MSDVAFPAALPTTAPAFPRVLGALGGLALLGTAAALGTGYVSVAVRTVPSAILVAAGAAALTSPALVVAHQLLSLKAAPEDIISALGTGLIRLGGLAAGLAPFVFFFALTSGLAPIVYALSLSTAALLSSLSVLRDLIGIERRATGSAPESMPMAVLATAWVGLTGLVALRLSASLFFAIL